MDDPYIRMLHCTDDGSFGEYELLTLIDKLIRLHGQRAVMGAILDGFTVSIETCERENRWARREKLRIARLLLGETVNRIDEIIGPDTYREEPDGKLPVTLT